MSDMILPPPGFDRMALMQAKPQATLRLSRTATDADLTKAAEEFEAVFIGQMLSSMWQGIETDGTFGGGHAEETFRGLLVEQYGKEVARAGGLGIAAHVKQTLLQAQEMAGGGA